jgi:hypothetical protein
VLDKGIKESGDHEIAVRLHAEVTAKLKIKVAAASAPEEAAEEDAPKRKG